MRLGPVEMQLAVLMLEREPALKPDDTQTREILAAARAVRQPLQDAYTAVSGMARYLREDQIQYLQAHRGPLNDNGPSPILRSLKLLATRSAQGGGTLPPQQGTAPPSLGLTPEEIAAAPIRLESVPALRLNAAQAVQIERILKQAQQIDLLENQFAHQVLATLRPDQIRFLERSRPNLEVARHMVPYWMLNNVLSETGHNDREQ